uniref:BHLH transcription factor bHLH3.2 n=1 Tax=Gardenia jasminoides TaxID=114476 RepID=A0A6M4C8K9_GARJA|nr:bHLH transcription factor bHLH3.2 [Gardenia jasminoides]
MPAEINPQKKNLDDDAVSEVLTSQGSFLNLEETAKSSQKRKKTGGRVRPASQTYDHIIAERKRREQLSQRFVALSTLVPGLKKMDKTSVLGDAISYLKHLQERVKTLEEQTAKQNMESMVFVKRSQLLLEDEGSSDETGGSDEQPLPEIEAKVCNKNVLLRVHCENDRGVLVKILSEVEKLNLAVIHTSVAPFGCLVLDVTLIAEMDKEFNLTMQELVKSLRSALQRVRQGD